MPSVYKNQYPVDFAEVLNGSHKSLVQLFAKMLLKLTKIIHLDTHTTETLESTNGLLTLPRVLILVWSFSCPVFAFDF